MSWSYRLILSGAFGLLLALGLRITQLALAYADCLQVYQTLKGPEVNIAADLGNLGYDPKLWMSA